MGVHGEECKGSYGVICLSCGERAPDLWQAFEDMQKERDAALLQIEVMRNALLDAEHSIKCYATAAGTPLHSHYNYQSVLKAIIGSYAGGKPCEHSFTNYQCDKCGIGQDVTLKPDGEPQKDKPKTTRGEGCGTWAGGAG